MADFNVNDTVEETMENQETLENLAEIVDTGFDVKPIAIGMAVGATTIALAKPAAKLAIKGAKWAWANTGAKLVNKAKGKKPEEKPEDPKPEEEKPAEEKPEEKTE